MLFDLFSFPSNYQELSTTDELLEEETHFFTIKPKAGIFDKVFRSVSSELTYFRVDWIRLKDFKCISYYIQVYSFQTSFQH